MRNPLSKQFRDKLRPLFFSGGVIITLGFTILAFQWKMETPRVVISGDGEETFIANSNVPRTIRELKKPEVSDSNKKIKRTASSIFTPIDDFQDVITYDDGGVVDSDTMLMDIDFLPELVELVDVSVVQIVPYFKSCGLLYSHEERSKCLNKGMAELISQNFNVRTTYRNIPTIWVEFTVKNDGSIDDVNVIKGGAPDLNEEAIRVIQGIKGLYPGQHNGRAVNTKFTIPIRVN